MSGERAGVSNDAAFVRTLHDEHAQALHGFCLGFTGDPQRAEDIVQEVLVRAWRNAATLRRDERPIRPWLFAVARNLLIDAHRAEEIRPPLVSDDTAAERMPGGDDIGRAVESGRSPKHWGGCRWIIGRCSSKPTGWVAQSARPPRSWASHPAR